MRLRSKFLFLLLVAAASCSPKGAEEPVSTEADETAIRNMAVEYRASVAAGDFQKFLSFFTDDVVVMPPDNPALRGMEAFTVWAKPFFDQYSMEEDLSYDAIYVQGDRAVGTWTYKFSTTPKAGGSATEESGKGMGVLARSADGSWKWSHTIWNRDKPVTPSPSAP